MNIAKYFFIKIEYWGKYFDQSRILEIIQSGLLRDKIAFAKASKFSGRELTSFFVDDLIKIR